MSNYIRFFHLETHRFTFLEMEALVTLLTLLLFVVLPVRYLAFFPNAGFHHFAQKRLRACVVVFCLSFFGRIALLPKRRCESAQQRCHQPRHDEHCPKKPVRVGRGKSMNSFQKGWPPKSKGPQNEGVGHMSPNHELIIRIYEEL